MKAKFKPVGKAEIRERVEKRFRARGALAFHGFFVLLASAHVLSLAQGPWLLRGSYPYYPPDLAWIYCLFVAIPFALHAIRYSYRHGPGRHSIEAETEDRVDAALRASAPEYAEETEALIRLQQDNKLKSRRFLQQHLSFFLGFCGVYILRQHFAIQSFNFGALDYMAPYANVIGIWSIGLGAHLLRYFFAHGGRWEKRQAKLDQLVERELRRERRGRMSAARVRAEGDGAISMAEIESVGRQVDARSEQAR